MTATRTSPGNPRDRSPAQASCRLSSRLHPSSDDLDADEVDEDPLMEHLNVCKTCLEPPAHILMVKRRGTRARHADFQDSDDEVTAAAKMGLSPGPQVLRVVAREVPLREATEGILKARKQGAPLTYYETTEFVCDSCSRGGICLGCEKAISAADDATSEQTDTAASGRSASGSRPPDDLVGTLGQDPNRQPQSRY